MYVRTDGIVLMNFSVGDFDEIVVFYTKEFGKIKVFFKGVKKPTAKLLPLTEIGTEVELYLHFVRNYSSDYSAKAIGGLLKNSFYSIKTNYERYLVLCKIVELVDCLTMELLPDENKYLLLKRGFEVLQKTSFPEKMFLVFMFRFINLCGYKPQIEYCEKCKAKIDNNSGWFDFVSCGLVCSKCYSRENSQWSDKVKISLETINLLKKFCMISGEEVDDLKISEQEYSYIKNFLVKYISKYAHYNLRTLFV